MLTWTREKPKEPGWYRYRGRDGQILLLHLKRVDDGAFFEGLVNTAYPWDLFAGEWLGPIEPPSSQIKEG